MAGKRLETLEDLLVHQLEDIYDAETQLLEAIPQMRDAATNDQLRDAFSRHEQETRNQRQKVGQIFEKMGMQPSGERCVGMAGLIEEGRKVIENGGEPAVLDAALIASAQKVEHYEMASYGCIRTYAQELGMDDVADIAQQILEQEGQTDEKLTTMAETSINLQARAA